MRVTVKKEGERIRNYELRIRNNELFLTMCGYCRILK